MSHIPVGSFPYERWAFEVEGELRAMGLDAAVDPRGPRAYHVLVPETESPVAGEILAGLGYLTCPVPTATLAGVKDWRPDVDPEEILDTVRQILEEKVEQTANRQAAEAWSTAEEDLEDRLKERGYEDPWVMAEFGEESAVKGELVEDTPTPPDGYESVHEGGSVPVVEEHVDLPAIAEAVRKHASDAVGVEVSKDQVSAVMQELYGNSEGQTPVSVSGDVTTYAKPIKE